MPRPRKTASTLVDQELPGLTDLDADPQPAATRGRPRKTAAPKTAGNRGRIPSRTSTGRIASKAQLQAKVASELYAFFSMGAAGWELRDPECASVCFDMVTIPGSPPQERLQAIVDRVTAIIARNDDVLRRFAETGIIGEIVVLCTLLFPIGRAVFKAHGPNGTGHQAVEETYDASRYPAYSASNS